MLEHLPHRRIRVFGGCSDDALLREHLSRLRRQRLHGLAGGSVGRRAPAATGFDHPLAGPQVKLAADKIHLRKLRVLQGRIPRRKVCAGVDQLAVKPQPIEVITEIVVAMDMAPAIAL